MSDYPDGWFAPEGKVSKKPRTDTELLDGLEKLARHGDCPGVINDDNGHWAVSGSGVQEVVTGDEPRDFQTTFFVDAVDCFKSIRDAIESYLDKYEDTSED